MYCKAANPGTVLAKFRRSSIPERERIAETRPARKREGTGRGLVHRQIGDELRITIERPEAMQEITDVDFIASEVASNGVRVDGELHANLQCKPNRPR